MVSERIFFNNFINRIISGENDYLHLFTTRLIIAVRFKMIARKEALNILKGGISPLLFTYNLYSTYFFSIKYP